MNFDLALMARQFAATNPQPTIGKGLYAQLLNVNRDPAVAIIDELWRGEPYPVEPERIAKRVGMHVIEATLPGQVRTVLMREAGRQGVIFVERALTTEQQRVVCARAIGQEIIFMRGRETEYEFNEVNFPNLESADIFAAKLLMPAIEWSKEQPVDEVAAAAHFGVPVDFAMKHFDWQAADAKNVGRSFVHLAEAHYRDSTLGSNGVDFVDEVMLVSTDHDGNTDGEIAIRWTDRLHSDCRATPYIHAFGDSWKAMSTMDDVIKALGKLAPADRTPDRVVFLVKGCGFVDRTVRVRRGDAPEQVAIAADHHPSPRG